MTNRTLPTLALLAGVAAVAGFFPTPVLAWGSQDWAALRAKCGVSMSYNSWVAAGSPCPLAGAGGGGDGAAQLGAALGTLGGQLILQGLQQIQQQSAAEAAQRQAAEAARQAEAQRAAAKAAAEAEETKNRLLADMHGVNAGSVLTMKVDGGSDLQLKTGEAALQIAALRPPEQLPKFVDDSLPRTAARDEVRLGYIEIMHHNWDAALNYFKQAQKLDPQAPGIGRLVDLAQYTRDRQTGTVQAPGSLVNPANAIEHQSAATPASDAVAAPASASAKLQRLEQMIDAGMNEDLKRQLDDFYRNYLPQHPEVAVAVLSSASATRAPTGVNLQRLEKMIDAGQDEELKRQLNDFYRSYLPQHPEVAAVLSSPSAAAPAKGGGQPGAGEMHAADFRPPLPNRLKNIDHIDVPPPGSSPVQ